MAIADLFPSTIPVLDMVLYYDYPILVRDWFRIFAQAVAELGTDKAR